MSTRIEKARGEGEKDMVTLTDLQPLPWRLEGPLSERENRPCLCLLVCGCSVSTPLGVFIGLRRGMGRGSSSGQSAGETLGQRH